MIEAEEYIDYLILKLNKEFEDINNIMIFQVSNLIEFNLLFCNIAVQEKVVLNRAKNILGDNWDTVSHFGNGFLIENKKLDIDTRSYQLNKLLENL